MSSIRLTCKSFAVLAKPPAFRQFLFYPFVNGMHDSQRFLPTKGVVDRSIARLKFWASDNIAHHVHELFIYPLRRNQPHDIEGDSDRLLVSLFQVLHHFLNLQSLSCQGFPFNDFALRQLCRLENLRTLSLNRSSITAATSFPASLRLDSLMYTTGSSDDTDKEQDRTNINWLSVAYPRRIQYVSLEIWYPCVAEHFLHFFASTDGTQYVTDLHMLYSDTLIQLLVSALSRIQSYPLKKLVFARNLEMHSEPLPNFGSVEVPSLQTYSGPHQLLRSVVPGCAIRHAYLCGLGMSEYSDPSTLLRTLRHLPDSIGNLQVLSLHVTYVTVEILEIVFSRCISLENLFISADPRPQTTEDGPVDILGTENELNVS